MFWNRRLNTIPFDELPSLSLGEADKIARSVEERAVDYDRGYEDGMKEGELQGYARGITQYEKVVIAQEERTERYLQGKHSVLWGHSFDLLDPSSFKEAACWLADQIRGVADANR